MNAMTNIKLDGEEFSIYNESGKQVKGSRTIGTEGLTPLELLGASLGYCTSLNLRVLLEREGTPITEENFNVAVQAQKAVEGPSRVEKLHLSIKLPKELSEEVRQKVITSAERGCTIRRSLVNAIDITFEDVTNQTKAASS